MSFDCGGIQVVDLGRAIWSRADVERISRQARTGVVVGVSLHELSPVVAALAERLTLTLAPYGPGRAWVPAKPDDLDLIRDTVSRAPGASACLASLLQATVASSVPDALVAESFAYSALLAGPEFAAWRKSVPRGSKPRTTSPVIVERNGPLLSIQLNRPEVHNAFGRAVRDGLVDALELAEMDDTITEVRLSGVGASFCSGGDLEEFGTAPDVVQAHLIRLRQSPAALLHRLGSRVRVHVHGACVGAGIELPSFAAHVTTSRDAWFALPELSMGLIPGAGGTVGISRRIGRWRMAYLALTGRRIDVETALRWGLVDARV